MSIEKKTTEAIRKAQEAVRQAAEALNEAARELNADELDQVVGAGSPFAEHPRTPEDPYPSNPGNGGF